MNARRPAAPAHLASRSWFDEYRNGPPGIVTKEKKKKKEIEDIIEEVRWGENPTTRTDPPAAAVRQPSANRGTGSCAARRDHLPTELRPSELPVDTDA